MSIAVTDEPKQRSLEMLSMFANGGMTYEGIGRQVNLSRWTVKEQFDELRELLGACTITHAITLAIGRGYLAVDSRSGKAFVPEQFTEAA